ncbi:ATP-binding protein [Methylobacter svalbardensis]|uniref:ATP-binding protein n=1 Tax=Methylobacter svalbardensis TaxID=3080016 RepID=UPI0030EEBE08
MISEQEILNASILIVDDQQSNVLLLEEMLRDVGYACITSTNDPNKVYPLHKKNRYDLILLDLLMPGMDGFQVMEGLKKIERNGYLPVLVITAQPSQKLRALASGAKDFISKPFDLVEIQTRIHNMLEVRLLYKKIEHSNQGLEQTVLERTAKLNSIFNAAVEGIITINMSDIIVSANAAVESIFGYKPEELIGCNFNKLMQSSPRALNDCNLPYAENYVGQIREIEGIHKNGSVVPLDLSIAEFTVNDAHYFTTIVRDVSLRKHREQQDKKHLDELAHVTRLGLMGEMASGIAHEVNQPLAAISSYTQVSLNLIKAENPDLAKLTEILSKTQQQSLRAGQIIQRMREFVKSHVKHRASADINSLLHDAVSLCIADLKQNSIELTLELENNLLPVYVDHIQIEQVLINLIRNSVDAVQNLPAEQQRQLTIHSRLTPNNDIEIRVKDNGSGLNEDQQQKISTPFYTTKADGMGMGLSISRSLIEAHEGTLRFNSEFGKGTTFYFTLPTA